jgi:peptidyl-dipeptidase Dcp
MSVELPKELATNPLCKISPHPFQSPDFPSIKTEHFKPAILEGMRQQLVEIKAITDNTETPNFENTIFAYERTGSLFKRAAGILGNLSNSDSNDAIMELEDELTPLYSNHSDDIHFNPILFHRIDTVFQDKAQNPEKYEYLSSESRRLIDITHREFKLAGAELSEADRNTMRQYNEKLSSLENKFAQNLIKISQTDGIVVTDVAELDGLTEDEINEAKETAKERKLPEGSYVITLFNTTRNPILPNIKNRELRKRIHDTSIRRGLQGEYQQGDIVYDILTTRAKVANLLGFENYSSYQLVQEMAQTPQRALKMLTDLVPNVMNNLQREASAVLKRLQRDVPDATAVEAHDWEYYAEKVRAEEYNVDPDSIKPYFEFENVIENCVFFTMNKLFGITFKKRTDIPTQFQDIYVYEIFDHNGETLGLFHADYFKRPANSGVTKSGGAWMSEWVGNAKDDATKAVIINNMNISKAPTTFLSNDFVSTALHELGHGLHGLFSLAQHASLEGTNVPSDFVEFPSTFMEDFSVHPEVLANYAKHHVTGEPIPADQLKRVIEASKFNLGFETLEYTAAALIDIEWHSLSLEKLEEIFAKFPTKGEAIAHFEHEILTKHGAYSPFVPPRYKTQYFAHSMTSYSSRYYAYIWSEVLAADAFRYITELAPNKGLNRENGDNIRKHVYSTGNTRDPMESYIAFRGSEPTTDALLLRRGLSVEKQ